MQRVLNALFDNSPLNTHTLQLRVQDNQGTVFTMMLLCTKDVASARHLFEKISRAQCCFFRAGGLISLCWILLQEWNHSIEAYRMACSSSVRLNPQQMENTLADSSSTAQTNFASRCRSWKRQQTRAVQMSQHNAQVANALIKWKQSSVEPCSLHRRCHPHQPPYGLRLGPIWFCLSKLGRFTQDLPSWGCCCFSELISC